MTVQTTLSILKPDAIKRNLSGKINTLIESHDLRIVAQKRILLTLEQAKKFYAVHHQRSFFDELCQYMVSGPVVVQVLHGLNAVERYRQIMGATNPLNAAEGTIRRLYGESVEANAVHGSDSEENAAIEIAFFFAQMEILD